MMIKVMLSVLQTMKFFLRTGFGDSATFQFGGTPDDPCGGLGQGNGAAPPAFTAVSTLLILAYVSMGHGVQVESAISGVLFTIAAILYVDDTDLLLWAKTSRMSDAQFLQQVQAAVTDWGMLALASGGSLRPEKCFWYFISFKFCNGRAYYKKLEELPSTPLTVPMRDGSTAPIELKPTDEATCTLGVLQCPEGLPEAHLAKMKQDGLDWADRASTTPLPRVISRMSHDHMLVPRMRYGIECLLATPSELSKEMRKVMYRALPYLGVNRNYKSEFCTLSRQYQRLELVDWPIEKLCADVFFMMQHWNSPSVIGHCLRNAYELLQMETGLEGNIFSYKFRDCGCLATHSWMKILWQYLDHFQVNLDLDESTNVPQVRKDDFSIINVLLDNGWRGGRLVIANRVRKHKKVHRGSCFTAMDGRTLLPFIFDRERGSSTRVWSLEEPMASDFSVWQQALRVFSTSTRKLYNRLGELVNMPHNNNTWTCNDDQTILCQSK
jgi:hypothetical protein